MTTFSQLSRSMKSEPHLTAPNASLQLGKLVSSCPVAYALMLTAAIVVTLAMAVTVAETETQGTTARSFFLVASRDMPDPVFQQSVILMLPADQLPLVAGVIINKPTDVTLGKLLNQPLAPANENQKVYFGGPVDLNTPLMVIRTTKPPKAAIRLWRDVYAITDPSSIRDTLKGSGGGGDARLFLGRAQWLQEQLRGELLEGAWTVVPLRTDLIFEHDSAKVWSILSKHEHVREINARGTGTGGISPAAVRGVGFSW
ncbi:MAG: YqgE/AlgH family protein [Deltaproteobacteria bacterium]|nr:YqgE/AlgH family protein [Deltaproteobacteria bacterium]